MTSLYAIGALTSIIVIVVWLAIRAKKAEGRAEVIAESAKQGERDAAKAGTIIAEHRTDSDTVDRLQSGRF